jgi:hypothetical protein
MVWLVFEVGWVFKTNEYLDEISDQSINLYDTFSSRSNMKGLLLYIEI